MFAINRVLRYDNIEDHLDNPGEPVELTAAYNRPNTVHHNWKYVAFGPDGKMYVQVGSNWKTARSTPAFTARSGDIIRTEAEWRSLHAVCAIPSA